MSEDTGGVRRGRGRPFGIIYDGYGSQRQNHFRGRSMANTNNSLFGIMSQMLNIQGPSLYSKEVRDDPDAFDNGYSDGRFYDAGSISQKPITQLLEKTLQSPQSVNSLEGIWSSQNNITDTAAYPKEEEIRNVFKNTDYDDDDDNYDEDLEVDGESRAMKYLFTFSYGQPGCQNVVTMRNTNSRYTTNHMEPKLKEITDNDVIKQNKSIEDSLENSSMSSSTSSRERNLSDHDERGNSTSITNTYNDNDKEEFENILPGCHERMNTKSPIPEIEKCLEVNTDDPFGKQNDSNNKQEHKSTKAMPQNDYIPQEITGGTHRESNMAPDQAISNGVDMSTNHMKNDYMPASNIGSTNIPGTKDAFNHSKQNTTQYFAEGSNSLRQTNAAYDFADEPYDDGLDYYDDMEGCYDDGYTYEDIPTHVLEKTSKEMSSKASSHESGRYSRGVSQFFNMPTFMKSIRTFAEDNDFEIHDDTPDGNCMFRAIVDQLRTNGDFSFSAYSLRLHAVRYLRENPYHTDGSHLESFLPTETWSEYLMRMESNSQWGDHMMLKAISDALNLVVVVINVYEDDIRSNEIQPVDSMTTQRRIRIYLGHIGEFHYLSLRRSNWETTWPYKAVLQRFQACESETFPTETYIQSKIQKMGIRKYIEEAELSSFQCNPSPELPTKMINDEVDLPYTPNITGVRSSLVDNTRSLIKTYGLHKLQTEETKDSQERLITDPLYIDTLTGIPIPHLSYIIHHTMPMVYIIPYKCVVVPTAKQNTYEYFTKGTSADESNVLFTCAKKDKKIQYYQQLKKSKRPAIVSCLLNYEVTFQEELDKHGFDGSSLIIADTWSTSAGYCRLIPMGSSRYEFEGQLYHNGSDVYLKSFSNPISYRQRLMKDMSRGILAFKCKRFPPCARGWEFRRRPSNWPSKALVSEILSLGCAVIQSAHPNSTIPTIEWKFIFTTCEQAILDKGISEFQKHAFFVFKVIIEFMTRHLDKQLKSKHLKSVFFYASENIAQDAWENCFSGCILYMCSALLEGLRKKCIPHYFLSSRNLLDGYSDEEIKTVSVYIEAFRTFPVESVNFLCERHGFRRTVMFANAILKDSSKFSEDQDVNRAFNNVFMPNLMRKLQYLSSVGYEDFCYEIIKKNYEMLLTIPNPPGSVEEKPSFESFFQNALNSVNDHLTRQQLIKYFENECGKTLKIEGAKNAKYLKDFIEGDIDDRIASLEIPETFSKDIYSVAVFIDKMAYRYHISGNGEMSFLCVEAAIRCAKQSITDGIDVSEIHDKSLKEEIGLQQLNMATHVNSLLYSCYYHLYYASSQLGSYERLRKYMTEMEEFCERVPTLKSLVSKIWSVLGNTERSLLFKMDEEEASPQRLVIFTM